MRREALAAALAAVLVYASSLGNGFAYDDVVVVRDNPLVQEGGPADVFTQPYWPGEHAHRYRPEVTYRPVTVLSFVANRRLFGPGPLSFHLLNVLLHAAASALVAWLGLLLSKGNRRVALLGGVLFAVHPIHTEAVANVVGRAELLAAVAWIAALIVHVRRPRLAPAAIFALALAAFLSKELAITLPVAMGLIAWRRGSLAARETLTDLAATALAALVFFAARSEVLGAAVSAGAAATYWDGGSDAVRLSTALVAFSKSLVLFAFPWTLSAEYSFDQIPLATGLGDPRALLGLGLLAAGVLIAAGRLRARPVAALAMGLFLVALIPVSHVFFPVNVIFAERLLYLPSVGLCLAVAAWAAPRLDGRTARAVAVAVLALLAVRAAVRNPVWANDAALFEQTVRDAPRCAKAWAALGSVRSDQGRAEEARACFEETLAIDPRSYAALDGLGHLALEREAWAEALERFQGAARVSPAEPAPLYNAGLVHLRGGNPQRAIDAFEGALKIDPRHGLSAQGIASAWQTLAVRLATAGRLAEAEEVLQNGMARVRELGGDTALMESTLADVRRDLDRP